MGKNVSRGQVVEVLSRVGTQVDWDQIDGDQLQAEVISLSPQEFSRRFTAFFRNGARFIFGGLKVATAPFDPAKFIGDGWAFWKGPKGGNGLEGEEERNSASLVLTDVDLAKAEFLNCLAEGEGPITGEVKIVRLEELKRVVYGATVFAGLWKNYQGCQNKDDSVLEMLFQHMGIDFIDFMGDVLRGPDGFRYVLFLYRSDAGRWHWGCRWLSYDCGEQNLSPVSQQV